MGQSVWFEEIDTALISFIKSKIPSIVPGKELGVYVRKPDEDFKKEDYPFITIQNLYSRPDSFRQFQDPLPVRGDADLIAVTMEDPAIAYDLWYQIDFWALFIPHMNLMTQKWIAGVKNRWFNLDVLDQEGNHRNIFALQQNNLAKSDLLDGSKRIFHSILTYRIYTEIDERETVDEPMVLTEHFYTIPHL